MKFILLFFSFSLSFCLFRRFCVTVLYFLYNSIGVDVGVVAATDTERSLKFTCIENHSRYMLYMHTNEKKISHSKNFNFVQRIRLYTAAVVVVVGVFFSLSDFLLYIHKLLCTRQKYIETTGEMSECLCTWQCFMCEPSSYSLCTSLIPFIFMMRARKKNHHHQYQCQQRTT